MVQSTLLILKARHDKDVVDGLDRRLKVFVFHTDNDVAAHWNPDRSS